MLFDQVFSANLRKGYWLKLAHWLTVEQLQKYTVK